MKANPYLIYFMNICIQRHFYAPFKSLQSQTPSPSFLNIIMGPNGAIESRWSTIGILQMQLPVCIDLYCMLLQLCMWQGITHILIVRTIEDEIHWSYILCTCAGPLHESIAAFLMFPFLDLDWQLTSIWEHHILASIIIVGILS